MAFQAAESTNADVKPFRQQYRLFHAAFAQFCYTGAQVGIAGFVSVHHFILRSQILINSFHSSSTT
jgi:fucose permease